MSRVLVVGDVVRDIVVAASGPVAYGSDTPSTVRTFGGGAGANVAAWLAAEDVDVTFCGRAGDDAVGEELRQGGVATAVAIDPERPTGTVVVVVTPDGERTMFPDRGANAALAPGDLPGGAGFSHLHLSGYTLLDPGSRPAGLAALALARAHGMTVTVDPASAAPLRAWPGFLDAVAGADVVLLPNRDEADVLGDVTGRVGAAATTLGADGARWTDGVRTVHAPAAAVDAQDTTGAGDAFAAGWIAARLGGATPEAALARAVALGARAVSRPGARPPHGRGVRNR